jgi:carbon monoxide dehydrogenase subunit G
MDMTGSRQIAASRQKVWAALNDPAVLRQCITGCESLTMQSPTDMTARVKLAVGPVRATFNGKVKLTDIDPPNGYRIMGEGSGGVAGFAKGGAVVRLADNGGGTLMTYDVKADVGGKLAQLGGRLRLPSASPTSSSRNSPRWSAARRWARPLPPPQGGRAGSGACCAAGDWCARRRRSAPAGHSLTTSDWGPYEQHYGRTLPAKAGPMHTDKGSRYR